jgi:hypothetical protein
MEYDEFYSNVENYFGDKTEKILEDYHHLLNKENRVLDIGVVPAVMVKYEIIKKGAPTPGGCPLN